VGVKRDNHNCVKLRMHQGAAHAEGISRRTSRRRDYEPVGTLSVNKFVVDIQLKVDHTDELSRVQYHIIERGTGTYDVIIPHDGAIQEKPPLRSKLAVQ